MPVLYFDDLNVGDEWVSPRRTVTEADVVAFACLSGDFNPIHVDHEFARKTPFGRPVAHGLLGMAIGSGLTSQFPQMATVAFLGIDQWSFLEPLFFGDTVHVRTEVIGLEARARGRRGVVTWRRKLVNQNGTTIQEGTTRTLVRGRRQSSQGGETDAGREPNSIEDSST
jgi:acyl dehydratase